MSHILLSAVVLLSTVHAGVITINDENREIVLQGEWFIKAYAPWCGACKSIAKSWIDLGTWSEGRNYNIGEIDITEGHSLSNELLVSRIPTLYHVKNGEFRVYRAGSRDVDSWKRFLENNEWERIEPLSWYRKPGSMPMTLFGLLTKCALWATGYHGYMTNELGMNATVAGALLFFLPMILLIFFFIVGVCSVHYFLGKQKPASLVGMQRAKPRTTSQSRTV